MKMLSFLEDLLNFQVEHLGINPTQFYSNNKLSTSLLVFLVSIMVHLHNRNKIISHLVNNPEM